LTKGPVTSPPSLARKRPALEQPIDAEGEVIGEIHLGDRDLDDDLSLRDVEPAQRLLDDRVLRRRRDHQQRVGILVGHHLQVAHDAGALRGAWTPGRNLVDDRCHCRRCRRVGCRPGLRWNVGGLTICPAGVPGATVGADGRLGCVTRPRERLLQERRQTLGARVLQVVDVELQARRPSAAAVEALDPLLHLRRGTRAAA
jgi:hypothetical protein